MGAITDARAELVTALNDLDAKVTGFVPERLNPPALMVVHGSPLLESGDTFGSVTARFEVWIVSKLSANANMTNDLDALIEATIDALIADDWAIERVEQPFTYAANGGSFLASTVTVTTSIKL